MVISSLLARLLQECRTLSAYREPKSQVEHDRDRRDRTIAACQELVNSKFTILVLLFIEEIDIPAPRRMGMSR
jgi:hypothetical protein